MCNLQFRLAVLRVGVGLTWRHGMIEPLPSGDWSLVLAVELARWASDMDVPLGIDMLIALHGSALGLPSMVPSPGSAMP